MKSHSNWMRNKMIWMTFHSKWMKKKIFSFKLIQFDWAQTIWMTFLIQMTENKGFQNLPPFWIFPPTTIPDYFRRHSKNWKVKNSNLTVNSIDPKRTLLSKSKIMTVDLWHVLPLVDYYLNPKSYCMDILVIINTLTKAWVSPGIVVTALLLEDSHQRALWENHCLTIGGPKSLSWLQVILVSYRLVR